MGKLPEKEREKGEREKKGRERKKGEGGKGEREDANKTERDVSLGVDNFR